MELKKIFLIICLIAIGSILNAQQEEVGPIMGNPQLQHRSLDKVNKQNSGTFDGSFIYTPDTIDLPLFDEFSTSKFQTYSAGFSDPGVTFDKVYRLLDMSNTPLANDLFYTEQETFIRTVDLTGPTFSDVPFTPIQVQIGDLSSYPVVHVPTNVYPPYYIYDTLVAGNLPDTVWIVGPEIFQDSATQYFAPVNDPELIWLESEAYHNYSLAVNPWSLGVASFDGLDENGFPYNLGTTLTNYADNLTSKPVDMSGVSASDSVYLSFLYQPQGFGDEPEGSDSLILEFYAKDLDQWNWIWSTQGSALTGFEPVHIRVDNPDYFKKGFQLRFRNYGSLSGSLDHFHLDYVNLRTLSGYQDTVVRDFAFVYPIHTLLETFTSVPWDHYKNTPIGKITSSLEVVVRNSDNTPENEQDGTTEIMYGGFQEGSFILSEALLNNGDLNYLPWTTYYSYHDFSAGDRFDETKTGLYEEFDIVSAVTHQNSNFTLNDSTYSKQYFQNYYSYDDGSAEQSYGPTGNQSMLAIKYTPYEADSVIGAMIHFVPSVVDVTGNLFLLTMWDDNGGEPGNVIYEDDVFFPRQPSYEYDRNIFTDYYTLDTLKVPVTGTFYIGWRQFDPEKLGVGLDRNIVNNDKTYYSVDGGVSWNQSGFQGSVMIRPIFSTSFDAILGIESKEEAEMSIRLYPNPTANVINIEVHGAEYNGAEVFNIQGGQIMETSNKIVDLSSYPTGIYFVKINRHPQTFKVIKQ